MLEDWRAAKETENTVSGDSQSRDSQSRQFLEEIIGKETVVELVRDEGQRKVPSR